MIGNRIRLLRKENDWNQLDLAKRIGVGRTTITAYETGQAVPALDKIQEMAKVFHVSIHYLTGESNSRNELVNDAEDLAETLSHLLDQLKAPELSMKFQEKIMSVDQKKLASDQIQALFTLLTYVNNM